MRTLKMLKNVAMLLPIIELYVIIPTQLVESYMWTHEGLWYRIGMSWKEFFIDDFHTMPELLSPAAKLLFSLRMVSFIFLILKMNIQVQRP